MRINRTRTRAVLAGGAFVVTASLTATVTGLVATSGGPFSAPAAAAELRSFGDCDELLAWYVRQALPSVGPWGLDSGIVMAGPGWEVATADGAGADASAASGRAVDPSLDEASTSSDTGTNVQEAGVEEPDRAKTDGRLVVHLRDRTLVVTDVSAAEPREVGTLRLPDDLSAPELLLSGSTVLVVGSSESFRPLPVEPFPVEPRAGLVDPDGPTSDLDRRLPAPGVGEPDIAWPDVDRIMPGWSSPDRSRLLEVSLSDPSAPQVVSDRSFGGALASAREHDGTVRLVLRTDRPTIDFVRPDRDRTEAEARRLNEQLVRESTIDDWLPSVREGDGAPEPLVACEDVRHPTSAGGGYATVTVATLPASAPEEMTTTAVTTSGDTVYSSLDRLYLAVPDDDHRRTDVHAFAVDGTTTSYVASGSVEGIVRDRWAMDEDEGVLRLAVAHLDHTWTTRENGVAVLRERGGRLEVSGEVRGLGPDEEIKSVRWFDDLAVVVTFRQTDPLYTVDLTDPTRPRTLGQLKVPGFSEYLHPIGDDRLLGVGHDATLEGQVRGGQLSLFDIGDLAAPTRVATLGVGGRDVRPVAGWEPRAFTWLGLGAGVGTALTAVSDDATGKAWLAEVFVTADALTEGRRWALPEWEAESGRALPLPESRVALVGSSVDVVTVTRAD